MATVNIKDIKRNKHVLSPRRLLFLIRSKGKTAAELTAEAERQLKEKGMLDDKGRIVIKKNHEKS